MSRIVDVSVEPRNLPLNEPFEIALGTQYEAPNVLVTVETAAGEVGYGESSPDHHVTGETQGATLETVEAAAELLLGRDVGDYRALATELRDAFPGAVSTTLALETAILDAYCRSRDIPLAELFGGRPEPIRTGLTIPITAPERAAARASEADDAGFETLKVKAGTDLETDLERVRAVSDAVPDARLVVDANQGWTVPEAVQFETALLETDVELSLLEQPVSRTDVTGLATVRERTVAPVAADEAVFSPSDAMRVVRADAADVINVKLGKSGLLDAMDIAAITRAADRELMIGCMLESEVGIHASAHLVAGVGGFSYVDLDALSLLDEGVTARPAGPHLEPTGPGHGIDPVS